MLSPSDLDRLSLEDVADWHDYLIACEDADAELWERRNSASSTRSY